MEQELNQKERPQEETSGVTSTDETPTSEQPRTYTEEELRTLQSKADKQIYEAQSKAFEEASRRAQLEEDHNLSVKQLQELQQEQDRKEDQSAEGDSETLSAIKVRRQIRQAKLELEKKEREITHREQNIAAANREQYAHDLAKYYGVPIEALKDAVSPEAMEVIALRLEREKSQGKKEPKKDQPHYDKGISDASKGWDSSNPMENIRAGCEK